MRIKYLIFLFSVIFSCAGAEIVRDGKACADIVVARNADAGTRQAAQVLQKYVQLISGARLEIVSPEQVKKSNIICVGESIASSRSGYKAPVFKTSGYDIWSKGSCVVLTGPVTIQRPAPVAGTLHPVNRGRTLLSDDKAAPAGLSLADDCGPMHAVSAFLEHLGVRFYAPYKEGTVIPRLKNIRLGELRRTKEAAFARREYLMGKAQQTDPEAVLWFKLLKSGSALEPVGVLSLTDIIREGEKKHPEWAAYNLVGEKMMTSDGCIFPRFADKNLQKASLAAVKKYFDAHPHIRQLLIVPPVLRGYADKDDLMKYNPKDHYPVPVPCNILAAFYRAMADGIAQSHPGKTILYQGFFNKHTPDAPTVFPANMSALPFAVSPLTYHHFSLGKGYFSQVSKLAKLFKTDQMQQQEWWNEFSAKQIARQPFFFAGTLQKMRQQQKPLMAGFVMETSVDPRTQRLAEVPLTHFMYYVNSKLLWDPELDLKALTDEYCRLWFGPAAEEMNVVMRFCENISAREERSLSDRFGAWTPANTAALFELLERAEKKTSSGSIYRRRVAALKSSLAGLKDVFPKLTAAGPLLTAEVIPWNAPNDLDLKKYKKWHVLPGGKNGVRTEYAIAFSEHRLRLFVAFRCYEPDMKKLKAPAQTHDDDRIFSGDHVRIDFNNLYRSSFLAVSDSAGHLFDGSTDAEELARTGGVAGSRDREYSGIAVKRFADRWEAEIVIDLGGAGKVPGWNPLWGVNVSRVRTAGGKKEVFALAQDAEYLPVKWHQLTAPKVDSKGRPLHKYNGVIRRIAPDVPLETVYTVKRAASKVSLSDPWDDKSWKNIPALRLGWEGWDFDASSGYTPDARAKFQYDDKYIYVLYRVTERNVRGAFKKDQEMVCLDSCMEFFVRPVSGGSYFNFECNCIGTLLLYDIKVLGERKQSTPVSGAELKKIKRFATLPRDLKGELPGPVTWYLGLQIPIDFFVQRTGIDPNLSGQVWTANVFKCADWTATPSWLMWKPAYTFHAPEEFGFFIFE